MGIIVFILLIVFGVKAIKKITNDEKQKINAAKRPPPLLLKPKTPEQIAREYEREKARERAKAAAATDIEYYNPLRRVLIEKIKRLESDRRDAVAGGYTERADKINDAIQKEKARLYRTEKKLEKAYFIIDE